MAQSNMARMGKSNGRWDGGKSSDYRRRVMGAHKGDGMEIHHRNENKSDNRKSNFVKITKAEHNRRHPEKGGRHK